VRRPRRPERPDPAEADERAVRTAALALLAGRDFARQELADRLQRKGYRDDLVEAVIERLQAEQFLSDHRFAEQYAVQRAARGKGPVRIRQELAGRGVTGELADKALDMPQDEWVRRARELRRKRFGEAPPQDFRERVLQYRGFSAEQIRAALGPGDDFES